MLNHWPKPNFVYFESIIRLQYKYLYLKDIQDMAHGENDDSFDRPTFRARENSLVSFTVK